MASEFMDEMINREVPFCRVYTIEAKEKLERIFLKNRISYFIEWQEKSFLSKLMGKKDRGAVFTIKINEDDVPRATELVRDLESVKFRKQN